MGDVARALVLSVVDVSDAERQKGNGLFRVANSIRARAHVPSWLVDWLAAEEQE